MARSILLAIALSCLGVDAAVVSKSKSITAKQQGKPLKEKMPWYHTTQEIHDEVSDIAASCQGAQIDFTTKTKMNTGDQAGTEIAIDVLRVRKQGAAPRSKAMFVFGEHARELVSPESGLDFLRKLCGQGASASRVSSLLDNIEFTVVPNANPLGRKKVEEGFYCKRTNEDNVDLNRNWGDDHRGNAMKFMGDEMDPGPQGFSEPETQILRDLAEEVKPDVYLSIHSGAYLLGAPYGYTAGKTPENQASMVEILKPISERYCGGGCPYGGLAELIGYDSMGCDVDYMAEHVQTPFAYTWEIYVGPEIRKHYIAEAAEQSGSGGKDALGDDDDQFFQMQKLNLVQKNRLRKRRAGNGQHNSKTSKEAKLKAWLKTSRGKAWQERPESEQDWDSCIEQFNPRTAEATASVVDNWTGAYFDLAESVDAKRHTPSSKPASPKATTAAGPVSSPSVPETPAKDPLSLALEKFRLR